jgi:hypothetical protein
VLRRGCIGALVAAGLLAAACATAPIRVPMGPSQPLSLAEARDIFASASAPCRGVRTLTAEIGLSGRVGDQKLRGRVLAGIELPGAIRLEAPAPFGAPVFILAARGDQSVLWFPRDKRVLNGAPVEDVIEALTGMRRGADDLLALLAGCLVTEPMADAASARRFKAGWILMPLTGGVEAFLRADRQQWRIVGGRAVGRTGPSASASWTVAYDEFSAGFPGQVRLGSLSPGTDMTLRVSQLETNVAIDPAAFTIAVPAGAMPMTLDELRQMGPLADRTASSGRQ